MNRIISIVLACTIGQAPVPPPPVVPVVPNPAALAISAVIIPPYSQVILSVTGGTGNPTSTTWLVVPSVSGQQIGNVYACTGPSGTYTVMAGAIDAGVPSFLPSFTLVIPGGPTPTPPVPPIPVPPDPVPPTPTPPIPVPPAPVPPAPTPTPPPTTCSPSPPAAQPAGPQASLTIVTSTVIGDPAETFTIDTADLTQFKPYINSAGWKQGPSKALTRALQAGKLDLEFKGVRLDVNAPDYIKRNELMAAGTKVMTGLKWPDNLPQYIRDHQPKPEHKLKARGLFSPDPTAPSFSWVGKGIISAPNDQGSCGSCWIFSSCKVFSAAYALKYGVIQEPSEQQVLLCDHNNGNSGCGGGNQAFDFMISPGVACEAALAYTGSAFLKGCPTLSGPFLKAASWGTVQSDQNSIPTVAQLKAALCEYGPLWVTVDASSNSFASYSGGVFVGRTSPYGGLFDGGISTDHAVTLVGWDDAAGAWLLENSWGESWGASGFWWHKYGTANVGYMASFVVPL